MPAFDIMHLLTWIHFAALAVAIGGAVAALLISGLESAQPEFAGLAPALWARQVRWGIRIAFILGVVLLAVAAKAGICYASNHAFYFKLPLAVLALVMAELAPRALATGRRGAALLALVLLLLASFVAINQGAFRRHSAPGAAPMVTPR
nr:hypothetical protein [uncultured Holophaga sp.]